MRSRHPSFALQIKPSALGGSAEVPAAVDPGQRSQDAGRTNPEVVPRPSDGAAAPPPHDDHAARHFPEADADLGQPHLLRLALQPGSC